MGREPAAAAETTAAWRKATNAPAEAAAAMVANEQVFHGAADYSDTAAEKREQGDHAEQALHGPAERDAKLLVRFAYSGSLWLPCDETILMCRGRLV